MSSCGMSEDLKWNKVPLWCVFKKKYIYGLSHTYMVMSMTDQTLVTRENTQKAGQCVPSIFSLLVADTYGCYTIASQLAKKDPH